MSEKYFVIDVNVLVSAFLFFNSKPRQALDKAQDLGMVLLSNSVLIVCSQNLLCHTLLSLCLPRN